MDRPATETLVAPRPRLIVVSAENRGYDETWEALRTTFDITRLAVSTRSRAGDLPLFGKGRHIANMVRAFSSPRTVRDAFDAGQAPNSAVVVVGHMLLPFLWHNRNRMEHSNPCFVFALFFHNARLMALYGRLARALSAETCRYILFSKADIQLFHHHFGLTDEQIRYVPYGKGPAPVVEPGATGYCFSGGYSNRDYETLIDAFRDTSHLLVICCSRRNKLPRTLPPNVTVHRDLPRTEFLRLIAGAAVCIMPLREGTGASGQSVTLQYMQYAKPIVAVDTLAASDYLDSSNAVLVPPRNPIAIADAVTALLADPSRAQTLGARAAQTYRDQFQASRFQAALTATFAAELNVPAS